MPTDDEPRLYLMDGIDELQLEEGGRVYRPGDAMPKNLSHAKRVSLQAAGGDQFSNDGKTYLKITNGGGAPITVTVVAQRPCDQGTIHSIANSVTNATTEVMGPFSDRYNDALGFVQVTYSGVTTVTVGT